MINIFIAGTHTHETPKEADALIQDLLNNADVPCKDKVWQCRIDRQEHASTLTPPIRVINFKPYGIVLKVKSEATDTRCQIMTLQLPEGINESAENVFNKLKNAEKSVCRIWKKTTNNNQPVITMVNNQPMINNQPTIINKVEFENLAAINKNEDKLIAVLNKVDELSKRDNIRDKETFINVLREELGWTKFLLRICSRALNELVSQNYIMEVISVDGRRIKGFTLTDKGAHVLLRIPIPIEPKIVRESAFLVENNTIIIELAKISEQYNNNLNKKKELQETIIKLDEENHELENKSKGLLIKLRK